MERSVYRFSLDIRDSIGACQPEMKQGDTHRRLCINLTDGGVPYPIGDGCRVVFTAKKPDGTVIYNTCAVENNTVIYDITPQTTAEAGIVSCELQLYDGAAEPLELLTSAVFGIRVHARVYNEGDTPASEAESTGISAMLQKAEQAVEMLEQARDSGEFDGMSATHSWKGTVLTVTSASGTTSADLKGEKGEKGDPGIVNMDNTAIGADAWSSKTILDRLSPGFAEEGGVVQCEPPEGYPLEAVSRIGPSLEGQSAITLTQCGKNLFDCTQTTFSNHYVYWGRPGATNPGTITTSSNFICSDYVDISHLQGQTIMLNHCPADLNPDSNAGLAFYDADKVFIPGSGTPGYEAVVPDNAVYIRFTVPKEYTDGVGIQIELGSTVTEYQAYREKTYTAEPADLCHGGSFDWTTGQLTVTHKKVDLASLDWFFESGYFGADILNTDTGVLDATAGAALCNCLTHASGRHDDLTTGGYGFDEPDCVFDIADGEIAVIYRNADNLEEFRDFLTAENAVLVYPLAEPEVLEYDGQTVPAFAGVNTLYSSTGDTRVSGRTDPVTVIEKLTNAILSLGGKI